MSDPFTTGGGPKDVPPPEPIPEVPSKPIPDVGSDTATPTSEANKELRGTVRPSGKKGRKRRNSSLAVATDKEEDVDANNSEAEQGDLDTQPSGSAPGKKTRRNRRGRKGKDKSTPSSPCVDTEGTEDQEASDGDEEPSSSSSQDANAGAAGDASGKKRKNRKKGSQASSGLMSPPLEPNAEVAQLHAQLAQLTDLVQQLVVEKTRNSSADQGRSRRNSSVTKGNPKIRRTSSGGGGGDGEAHYDSDGNSIHDEDEELDDDDDDDAETGAADETTKAKRFMGMPYRRGSKSKSDKGEKGDKAKDKHQQQVGEDPTSELEHAVLKTTPREEDEQTGNSPQIRDVTAADNERTQQELFAIDNVNVNVIKNESRDSEAGVEFALGQQVVIERQGDEHADEQSGAEPAEQLQQGRGGGHSGRGQTTGPVQVSAVSQQAGQEQGAPSNEQLVEDEGRAQSGTDSRNGVRGLGPGGRGDFASAEAGHDQSRHDGHEESGQAGLQEAEGVVGGWGDGSSQTRDGDGCGVGVDQSGDCVDHATEGVVGHDEESVFGHDSYHIQATSKLGSAVRDRVDFRIHQAEHDEESRVGNDSGSVEATVEHGLDGRALGRAQDEHGLSIQELQHDGQVPGAVEDTRADQSGTEHRSRTTGDGQHGNQSARESSVETRSVAGSTPAAEAGNDEASVDGNEPSRLATAGHGGAPRIRTGSGEGEAQDARPADVRYDVKVSLDINGHGYADSGFGVQQRRTGRTGAIETGIWVGVWIKLDSSPPFAALVGKEQDQQDDEDARVGRLHKEGQTRGFGGHAAGDEQTGFVRVVPGNGRQQAQQDGSDDLRDGHVQTQEEYKPRDPSPGHGLETGNWIVNAAATAPAVPGKTGSQPGAQVENGQLQQGDDAGADQGQERQDSYAQPPRAGHSDADAHGIVGERALERVEAVELEQQPVPRPTDARGKAEQVADENGKSHVGAEHPDRQQDQCLPGETGKLTPGHNNQCQPDGAGRRDGRALASQPSLESDDDDHHNDNRQEGKVKDVLQERGHPGHGEQPSVLEQSETQRRALVPDAAASDTTAARNAEAGTAQLWTGRFPTGISTGDIVGSGNALPASDVIGCSSSSSAGGVGISAGNVVRVPERGDPVVRETTKGSGDGEHDESAQAGDVGENEDGDEYRESQGLEGRVGDDGDGRGEEGKEGDEHERQGELESGAEGHEGGGGHGNVYEEGQEGEGQGGLEDALSETGGSENAAGGLGVKSGVEEVTVSPASPEVNSDEEVELPSSSPSVLLLSDAAGEQLDEAVIKPVERDFDQQLEKDNSLNPQENGLLPSPPPAMSEIEPIEHIIISQQFQNDPSSHAVNPEDVQLPASPSPSAELAESENEPIEQGFNQQSPRHAMNPEQVWSTLSDAGDHTESEPAVEQAKQTTVEPLSPATTTADRDQDQNPDKVFHLFPPMYPIGCRE